MDDSVREFLEEHHNAIMATLRQDGRPHMVRVLIGLVDGKLWSSGTADRLRTGHLRRDPRAGLLVLDHSDRFHWMSLDCSVDLLEGPDAPELNLALYRALAGDPDDVEEYLQAMRDEGRLIYQFTVERAYGQY